MIVSVLLERIARPAALLLALMPLVSALAPAARASEILYAGDYNGNLVAKFDAVTGAALTTVATPFIAPGGESIGGLGNTLFAEGRGGPIKQYDLAGNFLNQFTPATGALGLAVAIDGKSLYATESGHIVQYSIQAGNYGAVLASAVTTNSWGVSINPNTGQVYVANGWSNDTKGGVQTFNADLTGGSTLVAAGDHALKAGAGLVFNKNGSDFWVANGGNSEQGVGESFVSEYTAAGVFVQKIDLTLTLDNSLKFRNAFGVGVDNAGNIYVSSQASNAVIELDASNSFTPSVFIQPDNVGTRSIKSIFFSGQTVPDPVSTPEPGSVVLILSAIPAGLFMMARRRRQTA